MHVAHCPVSIEYLEDRIPLLSMNWTFYNQSKFKNERLV